MVNAAVDDNYIINITCDTTLTVCINLENFGLEYCEQRLSMKHTTAHRHDYVKLVGENELSKLFPSTLAHRLPVGCPINDKC